MEYTSYNKTNESFLGVDILNPTFTEKSFRNQKREISLLIEKQRTEDLFQEKRESKFAK